MAEPTFHHERLDVYRLSIKSVAFPYDIAKGKSDLKRIVSMLTRLIQRKPTKTMDEEASEYDYRDAESEYEYE